MLAIDVLVGDGLHHVGAGHEHVAGALDHQREVGDRRRVDRTARAGAHDQRDLRDDAAGHGVAQEDVGIATEGDHALLDARAAAVIEADDRGPDLHGQVHDLADLLGMRLRERAAEDGEILAEDEDEPAVDLAVAGDHAIAEVPLLLEAEVARAMGHEGVELHEAVGVQQQIEALSGGELALLVLLVDAGLAAAEARLGAQLVETLDLRPVVAHARSPSARLAPLPCGCSIVAPTLGLGRARAMSTVAGQRFGGWACPHA